MLRLKSMLLVIILHLLTPVLKKKFWPVVFTINGGQKDVISQYLPFFLQRIAKNYLPKNRLYPIGFIKVNNETCLVLANMVANIELWEDAHLLLSMLRCHDEWRFSNVALGGVIPSCMNRHRVSINKRFVVNNLGTVFMLRDCIKKAVQTHPKQSLTDRPIAIIGSGYTGARLAAQLEADGWQINLFDIVEKEIKSRQIHFFHNNYKRLGDSGLIIILTTTGDDGAVSVIPHLKPNMVVLSDAHPQISCRYIDKFEQLGASLYSTFANIPGLKTHNLFMPDQLSVVGGCFLQAYVEYRQRKQIDNFDEFVNAADKLNISGYLVSMLSKTVNN